MKKILIPTVLFLCIGLMGCSSTKLTTNQTNSCQQAISTYLQHAKKTTNGDVVTKGNKVTVDYIGRLDENTIFDTSIESIAKACGKYMTGRNYEEGLSFTVGAGQMIPGFDQGVEGMKIGETKTIKIAPKDAYGERDENKLIGMTKDKIPNVEQYTIGTQVMGAYGQTFKVYKITDKEIIFDANHELAGKTLIFDITIKNIQK